MEEIIGTLSIEDGIQVIRTKQGDKIEGIISSEVFQDVDLSRGKLAIVKIEMYVLLK